MAPSRLNHSWRVCGDGGLGVDGRGVDGRGVDGCGADGRSADGARVRGRTTERMFGCCEMTKRSDDDVVSVDRRLGRFRYWMTMRASDDGVVASVNRVSDVAVRLRRNVRRPGAGWAEFRCWSAIGESWVGDERWVGESGCCGGRSYVLSVRGCTNGSVHCT